MSAAQQPEHGDDWMALADAFGVNGAPRDDVEWATTHRPHPMHAHEFTDTALAAVLANWSRAAAGIETDLDVDTPIQLYPVLDHDECESGDCVRQLCACPTLCHGREDNACSHGHWLCEGCRGWCPECRVDALDDQGGA